MSWWYTLWAWPCHDGTLYGCGHAMMVHSRVKSVFITLKLVARLGPQGVLSWKVESETKHYLNLDHKATRFLLSNTNFEEYHNNLNTDACPCNNTYNYADWRQYHSFTRHTAAVDSLQTAESESGTDLPGFSTQSLLWPLCRPTSRLDSFPSEYAWQSNHISTTASLDQHLTDHRQSSCLTTVMVWEQEHSRT